MLRARRATRSATRGSRGFHLTTPTKWRVLPSQNFVALDDALNALEAVDPRKCKVVEMRFFGGMSLEETAEALHLSVGTVKRDWRLAKAWLARELSDSRP